MYRKFFSMIMLIGYVCLPIAYADHCPTISSLKEYQATNWEIYSVYTGKLLSTHQAARFRQEVEQFALAEWSNKAANGIIHCYYQDKSGSTLDAYLAATHFIPDNTKHYWYHASGVLQCAASIDKCIFIPRAKA